MTVEQRRSTNGKKVYYRLIWGKGRNDKMGTGIFTYTQPKTQEERNHNKEALIILEKRKPNL